MVSVGSRFARLEVSHAKTGESGLETFSMFHVFYVSMFHAFYVFYVLHAGTCRLGAVEYDIAPSTTAEVGSAWFDKAYNDAWHTIP